MDLQKYTVTCLHCEHLYYGLPEKRLTPFDEAFCVKKNMVRCGNCSICEEFELRSGMVTTRTYPQKNEMQF